MEYTSDPIITKTIQSPFTHFERESTLERSENLMHRKEQHEEAWFYKELGKVIMNYKQVVIFGPTDAKHELFNVLRKDHRFNSILIDVVASDKMTENEQHAFVKNFFF